MPFDMMRVALGFAVMTIGAFGAMARPVHATRATETGSIRRRARRFGSLFVPARAWALRRAPVGLRDRVERRVREVVAEQLGVGVETMVPGVSLTDDLAADSLDLLELFLVLESRFAIALPRLAVDQVRTLGDLVDTVMASLDRRERSTSRPWPVKVRVVAPSHQAASVERAGALTPYAVQVISEDAARAGRGAQLEVTTPASADDVELASIRDEFAPLGRRGIDVTVRREADV